MNVIPAIDILEGRCVRLLRGDYDSRTVYSSDPVDVAEAFAAAGATRLHVVDLDGARGSGLNREVIGRLIETVGLQVQVAGGIRESSHVAGWLERGATAVVMGTTAVNSPDVFREIATRFPGRVLAALDVKDGKPAVTGWTETAAISLALLLASWQVLPLAGVIVTAVDRDGTLAGPDLDVLREALLATSQPVQYAGGMASLDHIRDVGAAGAAGVILGKALYEGRISFTAALAT